MTSSSNQELVPWNTCVLSGLASVGRDNHAEARTELFSLSEDFFSVKRAIVKSTDISH